MYVDLNVTLFHQQMSHCLFECMIWPKDGSDYLKTEMRSTMSDGGRNDRNHHKIGERRGSVIKSVKDCYIMVNIQLLCLLV